MEVINDTLSEIKTKKYLFWQFPDHTIRKYLGDLFGIDSRLDYSDVVRLEILRVHIKQICDTVNFMIGTATTYFINSRHSMRYVRTLEEFEDLNFRSLKVILPHCLNENMADPFGHESYLNNFRFFIYSVCKCKPNTYQLKRFLIKCEIDYEIVIQKRDRAIFEWEKKRRNEANELLS
jgi:hypothetical protein